MTETVDNQAASVTPSEVKGGKKDYIDGWDVMDRQVTQQSAGYSPYGATDGRGCASCQWFISPDSCMLVKGDIAATGLSDLYHATEDQAQAPMPMMLVDEDGEAVDFGTSALSDKRKPIVPVAGQKKASLIDRIFSAVGLGVRDEEPPIFGLKEMPDGRLRFFCTSSNNFTDREGETFIAAGHKEMVEYANANEDYPDLWYWHIKSSKFGEVDWMDFDGHFVSASGLIDVGKEDFARAVAADKDNSMSHGYVAARKDKDYQRYRDYELTVLPARYAANLGTEWGLGGKMAFSEEQRVRLASKNVPEEQIAQWEKDQEIFGKALESLGLGSKTVIEDLPAPVVAAPAALTEDRVKELIAESLAPVTELTASVKSLADKFDSAAKTVDDRAAEVFESKMGQLRQGHQASASDTNVVSGEKKVNEKYSWTQESALFRTVAAQEGVS